jgi:serine/threonine-protein kinase RsbT
MSKHDREGRTISRASGSLSGRFLAHEGRRRGRSGAIMGTSNAGDEIIEGGAIDDPMTLAIGNAGDVALVRQCARAFAKRSGFSGGDQVVIDAAVRETAANILSFAGNGEFVFSTEVDGGRAAVVIVARDRGPGIPDVSRAFVDGYSTAGRVGLGLAAARRLMDSFDVVSAAGEGTTITMKKWRESRR